MTDFPDSPSFGQTFSAMDRTWQWNGTAWRAVSAIQNPDWADVINKPATFPPATHSHGLSDVTGLQTALDGKQAAGNYATLVSGLIPSSQLPSYVDDVIEAPSFATLPTGETGKIYLTLDTGKIYRWSGSAYVEISPSPGTTTDVPEGTNLYFTNARASAAAPVQSVAGRTGSVALTKTDVGLGNVDNTADADKPVSTATATALAGKASTTDARLSDARTPTAHKSSHATGGTDALTPSDIGAASSTHSHAIADVTGLQAALDIKSVATVFAKTALPLAGAAGSQTLVTDGSATSTPAMAYFYQGKWYRTLDNTMIADKVVDVYLLAGQSNAHGHAIVSSLTTAQKTQNGLFYTSWHDDTNNASSTQYYSNWATSLVAGSTRGEYGQSTLGGSLLFGPELGFVNRANAINLASGRPIAILKHAIGASSLTDVGGSPDLSDWDLTATGDRKGDALRAFKLAIADALGKLTAGGYTYRLAGFIWWQGESGGADASLIAFISHIRTYLATTYGLDMPTAQFPFVITGTTSYWGTTYKANVANLDQYVGYVDSQKWSTPTGTETGNVHPGSGGGGFSTDADGDGQNDMYTIGQKFADQMQLAIAGNTNTPLWTPASITSRLWIDADDLTKLTVTSTNVTTIGDKSGNNNNFTADAAATIKSISSGQNGRAILRFDGNVDCTAIKAITYPTATVHRLFFVAKVTTSDANDALYLLNANGASPQAIVYNVSGAGSFRGDFYVNDTVNTASQTIRPTTNNLLNQWVLLSYELNSPASTISTWLNGTLGQTATLAGVSNFGGTINTRICKYQNVADADIGEILHIENATAANIEKVEGYLAHKWGLAGSLPAGHPYKTAAP